MCFFGCRGTFRIPISLCPSFVAELRESVLPVHVVFVVVGKGSSLCRTKPDVAMASLQESSRNQILNPIASSPVSGPAKSENITNRSPRVHILQP